MRRLQFDDVLGVVLLVFIILMIMFFGVGIGL